MLVRKAEPEQQKGLDQDEQHTRHATKRREGIFFEDGKRQEIERDEKGGHGDNRLVCGLLIGTGGGKLDQGSIASASTSRERIMRLLAKYQPKMSPKMRTIYGKLRSAGAATVGVPGGGEIQSL